MQSVFHKVTNRPRVGKERQENSAGAQQASPMVKPEHTRCCVSMCRTQPTQTDEISNETGQYPFESHRASVVKSMAFPGTANDFVPYSKTLSSGVNSHRSWQRTTEQIEALVELLVLSLYSS